jgi:hypothetical protein
MKFICLGYFDPAAFALIPENEQATFMGRCFDYDAELIRGGHFLGGEALQPANTAVTVRPQQGKAIVTDGPFAETKEYLGGILILQANDLNHAIALMSKHPGIRAGGFEIRAADESVQALFDEHAKHART